MFNFSLHSTHFFYVLESPLSMELLLILPIPTCMEIMTPFFWCASASRKQLEPLNYKRPGFVIKFGFSLLITPILSMLLNPFSLIVYYGLNLVNAFLLKYRRWNMPKQFVDKQTFYVKINIKSVIYCFQLFLVKPVALYYNMTISL